MPYITEEQMQHIVSATCEALRGGAARDHPH